MLSYLCVHKITQWLPCYCLHVERVKRSCYVYNIDTFNAMSKGSKDYVIHNIDTFNAMLKGSKDYVMLKQGTYTFLLITFLLFN